MKTLDEVIKANECCDHGEPDSRCEDCPYNGIGACCAERESDVLHYLKVLKDILDPLKVKKISHEITCPQCGSVIAILLPESNGIIRRDGNLNMFDCDNKQCPYHPENNVALSWDELKTMEGKPVWVEGEHGCIWNQKAWSLIWLDPENDDIVICISTDGNLHYEYAIGKEDYGTDWQAFRKERE